MTTIKTAFDARFEDAATVQQMGFLTKPRLFELRACADVKTLEREQVLAGFSSEGYKFLAINQIDGIFVIFRDAAGLYSYYCDTTFANLQTMQLAGFKTFGEIDTIEKFNHIMAIPDSFR
jgi:hypothetical protein